MKHLILLAAFLVVACEKNSGMNGGSATRSSGANGNNAQSNVQQSEGQPNNQQPKKVDDTGTFQEDDDGPTNDRDPDANKDDDKEGTDCMGPADTGFTCRGNTLVVCATTESGKVTQSMSVSACPPADLTMKCNGTSLVITSGSASQSVGFSSEKICDMYRQRLEDDYKDMK
ncbi:MAG: hypothetical protein AB7T49_14160 [Oligoflexales bacterium]